MAEEKILFEKEGSGKQDAASVKESRLQYKKPRENSRGFRLQRMMQFIISWIYLSALLYLYPKDSRL